MNDPFARLKRPAPDPCPHGYGDSCECQLPIYAGLFVVPMEFKDGKGRHVVVRVQLAHDGGMVQFTDPLSGAVVGSGGIHWFYEAARLLEDWCAPEPVRPPSAGDPDCPTCGGTGRDYGGRGTPIYADEADHYYPCECTA